MRLVLIVALFLAVGCASGRQEYRAKAQEPYGTGGDRIELPAATLRITVPPYSTPRHFDVKVFIANRGNEPMTFRSEGSVLTAHGVEFLPTEWHGYIGQESHFKQLTVPPNTEAGILCSFEAFWSREWRPEAIEFALGTVAVGEEEIVLGQVLLVQPE